MHLPDKYDQELFGGELKKHVWTVIKGLIALIFSVLIAYITQVVIKNLTAKNDIEYKISTYKISDFLPQNISDVAPLKMGDIPLKDAEFVTIQLWNRTSSNLDRISIRVDTNGDTAKPFHKIILFPDNLESDWVSWANPNSNDILEFAVDFMNINWSENPNISVRFFYPNAAPKKITLKTNKPGVNFVEFDEGKSYWWLFGLGNSLLIAIGIGIAFIILVLIISEITSRLAKRKYVGFARVLAQNMSANFPTASRRDIERFYWLVLRIYIYSAKRILWKEKNDPEIKIPDDVGSE